jgi:hypothetical protein
MDAECPRSAAVLRGRSTRMGHEQPGRTRLIDLEWKLYDVGPDPKPGPYIVAMLIGPVPDNGPIRGFTITAGEHNPNGGTYWPARGVGGVSDEEIREAGLVMAAAPELLAACESWAQLFDELDRDAEPGDRVAEIRREYHGKRLEATRAAIAKAKPSRDPRADGVDASGSQGGGA